MPARARSGTLGGMRTTLLAALAVAALGCSAALPPPSRALCYAEADSAAQKRVNTECPADAGSFENCTAKATIMADLQRAQQSCK